MVKANPQPPMDEAEQASQEVAIILDDKLLAQFAEMAVMIPADEGGGAEAILTSILQAKSWEDLNRPFETSAIDDILGKQLTLVGVKRMPSTFKGGLGQFCVVTLRDPRTGKDYIKTTGSISVVGCLAWLYANGATAVTVEWCRAVKPSRSGYFPQHLRVIDAALPDGHIGNAQATT